VFGARSASHPHPANARELIAVASTGSVVYLAGDGVRGDTGDPMVLSATTSTLTKSCSTMKWSGVNLRRYWHSTTLTWRGQKPIFET
jgi:hypothetical protein